MVVFFFFFFFSSFLSSNGYSEFLLDLGKVKNDTGGFHRSHWLVSVFTFYKYFPYAVSGSTWFFGPVELPLVQIFIDSDACCVAYHVPLFSAKWHLGTEVWLDSGSVWVMV